LREQWVHYRFDLCVDKDKPLDLKWDAQQRDRSITLWISWELLRFWDGNYCCSSLDFWELQMEAGG